MSLSSEELEQIATTREVVIETRRGGRAFRTVIWVAVDAGEVFVRSVRGEAGRWYQRALDEPGVALVVGAERFRFRASPAGDPESVERASQALRGKYPKGGSLDSMLRPQVLGTTLLLVPVP